MNISEIADLNLAQKAAQKNLCDHCLGRQFAKLGHGMSNKERGFYLRNALTSHIEDKKVRQGIIHEPFECWLCGNLFDELEKFAGLVMDKLHPYNYNTFLIGSRIDAEIVDREESLWGELGNEHYEPIKAEVNREVGKLVEAKVEKEVDFEKPDIVAVIDTGFDNVELQISPLYIYGRYKKLIRGIPQTRWDCKACWGKGCEKCNNTGKIYETSVEELVAFEVMNATKGAEHSFHGMGREDIDARMLGNGRPFILEIKLPIRRDLDLKKLEKSINSYTKGKVEVFNLRPSTKDEVVAIKEAKVPKTYEVEVEFKKRIKHEKLKEVVRAFKDRPIEQKTPKRVLHRRTDKIRKRMVIDIGIEVVDKKKAIFKITGESGIYVKELIHGDEGRTNPSIADYIKAKCEIKSLDVIKIHDESG
ncbi:MAG: tRNA pseudouridine(54/55) synthase Pus10 [Thermoplasmata archaeon]|nr:MAG: tRNA pseudouridine(54/55) synthase Pus10 [Thermoplasmata archaeon]